MCISSEVKNLRSFGLTVGVIFTAIGLVPVVLQGEPPRLWALVLGVGLMTLALVFPRSLRRTYRVWMALGHVLGWVNTRIILCVLFYGLFTPMGWCMRLLGTDPMHRRFEPAADSYRVVRQPRPGAHMLRQF